MIKLSKPNLGLIVSASASLLYVYMVSPNLEQPLSLFGFFLCIASFVFMISYVLLRGLPKQTRVFFGVVITISLVYLMALSSLNTLDLVDVLMVTVVGVFSWLLFKTIYDK